MNERFSLCAVTVHAERYAHRPKAMYRQHYIGQDIPENHRCVHSHVLIFELNTLKHPDKADFISCAVDREGKYPLFFLTNDPYSSRSMFSVDAMWHKRSSNHTLDDKFKGFRLSKHLIDVKILMSFDDSPKIN